MIIREILTDPELFKTGKFDYFNDAADTIQWLQIMIATTKVEELKSQCQNIKEKLEQQTKAYWDNYHSKKNL